jgi:hypothetical protein
MPTIQASPILSNSQGKMFLLINHRLTSLIFFLYFCGINRVSLRPSVDPHYSTYAGCWYYHMNQSMAGPDMSQLKMKKHAVKISSFLYNYFSYLSSICCKALHTPALYSTYLTYRTHNGPCPIQTLNAGLYER